MAEFLAEVTVNGEAANRWFEADTQDEARNLALASIDDPDNGIETDDLEAVKQSLTVRGPFTPEQAQNISFESLFVGLDEAIESVVNEGALASA